MPKTSWRLEKQDRHLTTTGILVSREGPGHHHPGRLVFLPSRKCQSSEGREMAMAEEELA